ncbi:MAG: efflux RND transporter permease subunit, partial [Gammaproteobacteria bacterium]
LQATEKLVEGVEAYLREDTLVNEVRTQGVTSWITYIGNGGPRFVLTHIPKPNSSHYALFIINTTSLKVIDEVMDKLNRHVWQFFPDATIKLKRFENGEPIENPVEIRVSGDNVDVLLRLAESIKEQLKSMNRVTSIVDDWGHRTKKISLHIDQDQVQRLGISNKDIALSMQTNLSGLALSQFRENDDIIPIVMRSEASEHLAVNQLGSLTVYSQQTGKAYSLSQVAQPVLEWESAAIRRRNLERTVTVGAQVLGDNTAISVLRQLEPWLHEPIAAFIILILLVGQFNSIRRPLIILTTIPLGVAGVIFGLLLFRSYFGFMTLLGIISLSGIVINNAIVLIERIQLEHHDNGVALHEAIIVAAQRRLRPILLTTATTVLGLIPLYWGGGEMWEP